jgi:hypothetical protein
MVRLQTALTFSKWASEFMLIPPFCILLPLAAVGLVWSARKQRPFQARTWKPHHWLVLSHVLFFVAAISLGVLNPYGDPRVQHEVNRFVILRLYGIFYGSLASCGFWIWRMKGFS